MNRHIINKSVTLHKALTQLNDLRSSSMTLFVVDDDGRMIGTVTDGDIRRAIVAGAQLTTPVEEAMHKSFEALYDRRDIHKVKEIRKRKIGLVPYLDSDNHIIEVVDLSNNKSILPIDAVLMAGGKGERLRPMTLTTPKPLLKIGKKAIIDRNIERLIHFGVRDISVTVNYLKDMLIDHFSQPVDGVEVQCVAEQNFLGTIGALTLIPDFRNDTILVMNSDLLTDIDFEDFYLHFKEHDAMMSAAAIPYTISVPYGIFDLDGRNIKGVSEKPVYNYYANAGIYLIKKEALRYIPQNEVFNATDLIDILVSNNQKVVRFPLTSLWIDIGTPDEYHKAQDLIKHIKIG
ncbi:MAG: NTP transferase domain-containing protein [Bacteroidales bacterium]|nr:NTP transferase domain-containing protein [Bacteroidales bacterium]